MDLVIIGAGGLGREALTYALDAIDDGWNACIIGWVDDSPEMQGQSIHDLPVLGGTEWLEEHDAHAVIAIGSPRAKAVISAKLPQQKWATIRHPTAYIGRRNQIGEGAIFAPYVVAPTDILFGRHVTVNALATVGHDSQIGDFATVGPGAHVSGYVHLADGVDIGSGAALNPGICIGAWSVIGAGAVANRDIAPGQTAVGVPAKALVRPS